MSSQLDRSGAGMKSEPGAGSWEELKEIGERGGRRRGAHVSNELFLECPPSLECRVSGDVALGCASKNEDCVVFLA